MDHRGPFQLEGAPGGPQLFVTVTIVTETGPGIGFLKIVVAELIPGQTGKAARKVRLKGKSLASWLPKK